MRKPVFHCRRKLSFILAVIAGLSMLSRHAGADGKGAENCRDAIGVSRRIPVGSNLVNADGRIAVGLASKEVVLTFDDGPSGQTTPQVLAALAKECVRATFFLLGNQAQMHPDLARSILAAGHTLGSHTQDHANLPGLPVADAVDDIERGREAVESAAAARTPLFRFPFLADSPALLSWTRLKGEFVLGADLDGADWTGLPSEAVVARVMARLAEQGRGVILLHDILPTAPGTVRLLLQELRAKGYSIVHLAAGEPGMQVGDRGAGRRPE